MKILEIQPKLFLLDSRCCIRITFNGGYKMLQFAFFRVLEDFVGDCVQFLLFSVKMKEMILLFLSLFSLAVGDIASQTWSVEKAADWQRNLGWRAGTNFIPSNAVNQLEMWQPETFDPSTIDRELQYAEKIGFSVIRVYLHDLLWDNYNENQNSEFLYRVEDFLAIADRHKMKVMLVFFDSCWQPEPEAGEQPEPYPGVHNSQWLQSPGYDAVYSEKLFNSLKPYFQSVLTHFKDDSRVVAWDVWNEPSNSKYQEDRILPLYLKVVSWFREIAPSQPMTAPVWDNIIEGHYSALQVAQLQTSDIISFHSYTNASSLRKTINNLQEFSPSRPILCTEFVARTAGSVFEPHLDIMKDNNVIAINWGLVTGEC